MIVPMKKATIIFQQKDGPEALNELRSMGVLHIEHQKPPQSQDINILQEELFLLNNCLAVFNQATGKNKKIDSAAQISGDWKIKAKHIVELEKRFDQLETYSRNLSQQISEWERWGDFEPQKIQELAEKGIYLRLYQVPLREIKNFPGGVFVNPLFTTAGFANCVTVSLSKFECQFKEIVLPKQGLQALRARFAEEEKVIKAISHDLNRHLDLVPAFMGIRKKLEKGIEFQQAIAGMAEIGKISYVRGYIPIDGQEVLCREAQDKKWGVLIKDPDENDSVPTLLRNPAWVTLIRPVLRMLGILPGYHELDVSLLFLVFFSIFFGILIGDAGYGISYFLITMWLQKKRGATVKNSNVFLLFYLLSICAIIWGVLTGTFFGQEWLLNRGIKPLLPVLNDPLAMQTFCFFLGAVHLTIAHCWRALVKFPTPAFLADLGWIAVLWVAYFLARTLILSQPFPDFGVSLAVCGMILVLFFNEPRKNVIKTLCAGLTSVTFGLSFMSTFTDVVSYVRLFAVGLAAVAIANTTNAIAASLGTGVLAFIGGVLIRIVGHALNIVLGPIAVMVHGIRLNVLEFGLNHTNITWSGEVYKPLA